MAWVKASTISFMGVLWGSDIFKREVRSDSLRVVAVGKDDIDVRVLQTGQGALEPLNDVLLGQAPGVGLLPLCAEEDLCRQDVLVTWPGELLEGLAHLELALSGRVDLGSVEEVDAVVPGSLHAVLDERAPAAVWSASGIVVDGWARAYLTVPPMVSHPPREKTETLRPAGPRRRNSMSLGSNFDSTAAMILCCGMGIGVDGCGWVWMEVNWGYREEGQRMKKPCRWFVTTLRSRS
jgi:hypothetical protein